MRTVDLIELGSRTHAVMKPGFNRDRLRIAVSIAKRALTARQAAGRAAREPDAQDEVYYAEDEARQDLDEAREDLSCWIGTAQTPPGGHPLFDQVPLVDFRPGSAA